MMKKPEKCATGAHGCDASIDEYCVNHHQGTNICTTGCFEYWYGADFQYYDLNNVQGVTSVNQCAEICRQTKDCMAFVLNTDIEECWLKVKNSIFHLFLNIDQLFISIRRGLVHLALRNGWRKSLFLL